MFKVSVIIPNYNHASFLHQRYNSIINQTYKNYELIILDDCSSDGSVKMLQSFTQNEKVIHLEINDKNSGNPFLQWQKGINLAKGDLIWIAESDDYCEPIFLEKMVSFFKSNSSIGIAFCQSCSINENNEIIGNWIEHTNEFQNNIFAHDFIMEGIKFANEYLIHKNVIPNASGVLFKKLAYIKANGIDPRNKYCADWNLWLKMATIADIAFSSESLNYFRRHRKSVISLANLNNSNSIDPFYLRKTDHAMRVYFQSWLNIGNFQSTIVSDMNKKYIYNFRMAYYNHLLWEGTIYQCISNSFKLFLLDRKIKHIFVPYKRMTFYSIKKLKKLFGIESFNLFSN